jgi:DNA alkylation damage repair protein AlkB
MSARRIEVCPGAVHLPGYLTLEAQRALAARCLAIGTGPAGWYVPTVRGGGKMRVQMVCLGHHWNARTYRYEATRRDHDGLPAPALPDDLVALASQMAADAGTRLSPDVCILNHYGPDGKMGLHQDKDEHPDTLDAGVPIVSVSIGDTAKFILGGLKRKDPKEMVLLASGDGFVFGGQSRLRFHGVAALLPDTGPPDLGFEGRFNLTFRQAAR